MNNWNAAYQPFIYEMILFFTKKYDKIEKRVLSPCRKLSCRVKDLQKECAIWKTRE